MRRLSFLLALSLACPAAGAISAEERAWTLELALARWDMETARWEAAQLLADSPGDPAALLLAARVAFHDADYPRAADLARQAGESPAATEDQVAEAEHLRAYLEERSATWDAFEEHASDNFLLRVTARDRLLVPYALTALERAAAAIGEVFEWCPPDPVVVEIYPSRSAFIAASTLTREEVETSGTVAICHYHRLMLISPAVLARGYDWLDTLAHEYVHYAVYHVGEDSVPVWLHEGLAKALEDAWRHEAARGADPRMTSILAEAREADRWVTFEEMHPSMAKLPSAPLVTLAFAQVREAVAMLLDEGGARRLCRVVHAVRDHGGDLDRALMASTGTDLAGFEDRVRAHVDALDLRRIRGARYLTEDGAHPLSREFQDEGEAPLDPDVEVQQLEDRRARDWTILGDRLKGREHYEAAVIEYDKALERLGHAEPLVVNKKAHALLLAGQVVEARPLLEAVLQDHPSLTTTLDNLAEVHLRLARDAGDGDAAAALAREHRERALALLRRSEEINPFNPDTHVRLAAVLERLGQHAEARRSRERLEMLLSARG